jgi:uncharacterized protein (TIGR02147 family)
VTSAQMEEKPGQRTTQLIAEALSTASNSSEAIRNLYRGFKDTNPRYSIPYICKKAGISSAGYLSDVMQGKRVLNEKYQSGIIKAFGLNGAAARYLKALFAMDHGKDTAVANAAEKRLPALRKALFIASRTVSHDTALFFFALEVFCAFGLFKNSPTLQNLADYFISHSVKEIHRAILLLKELQVIALDGEHYVVVSDQINFGGTEFSQIDYLKLAFKHGIQNIEKWYQKPECALFESINVSVKKSDLAKYLPLVRQSTEDLRLNLETDDGDMIVRLNLQIYPIEVGFEGQKNLNLNVNQIPTAFP